MEQMIRAYDLEKVDFSVNQRLKTKPIRGIYKPKNRAFRRLTVIDKENGGKADALNAGINLSRFPLFCAVDADSLLDHDSLLQVMRPFIEEPEEIGSIFRSVSEDVYETTKHAQLPELSLSIIGRFYLRQGEYLAAINRFRTVVDKYQTTSHTAEALERLTESYMALGVVKEAQTAAAVLGYNYPGSQWYMDAYTLLTAENVAPAENEESWISKAFRVVF